MSKRSNHRSPADEHKDHSLPSLYGVPLRELLDKYSKEPELLRQILVCKAEEDKIRVEELRYQTETVRLETVRLENEALREAHHPPQYRAPPLSQPKLNYPIVQPTPRGDGVTSLNQYALTSYPETNNNGANTKAPPPAPPTSLAPPTASNLPPPDNKDPVFSHRRDSVDNRHRVSTIQLRSIPAPYYTKRNPSRGEVLEALRNKVLNRNRPDFSRPNNALAPMQEHPSRNSPERRSPYHNGPPEDHPSGTHDDSRTTLSNLQPRDGPQDLTTVGPFSAPVGGPHLGFRYPPPTTETQHHDHNKSR